MEAHGTDTSYFSRQVYRTYLHGNNTHRKHYNVNSNSRLKDKTTEDITCTTVVLLVNLSRDKKILVQHWRCYSVKGKTYRHRKYKETMTTKENEFSSKNEEPPSFPKEVNGLPVEIDYDGAGRPYPSVRVDNQKFSLAFIKNMVPGGNIVEHLQTIRNIFAEDDDVLICTYPKSGTHWIWEIVSMLLKGKAEYDTKIKETAMLEFLSRDQIEAMLSPRILNTHFPLRMLPKDLIEKKRKIIHILRNPKDVAVSMYNHFKSTSTVGGSIISGTFSEFLPLFLSPEGVLNGGWNKYVREFEKFAKDNPDYPILTLYYEDMKQDPKREITKVAKFLDVPNTEELIAAVAERCEFEKLKKANDEVKDDYITRKFAYDGKQFMYRKGIVGDWKNWFTVAQNELFDETFERWMPGSELKLKFFL